MKLAAWALAGCALVAAAFFQAVPSIRSEALGVFWPATLQLLVGAAFLLAGLAASRRAGRLQHAVFVVVALSFLAYVHVTGEILQVAGVQGVTRR